MNVRARGIEPPLRRILDVDVAVLDRLQAIALLSELINKRQFTRIGFLNAHMANVARTDDDFSDVLSRFLILPDGVGVDLASKMVFGSPFPANLNGTDFIPALLRSLPGPLKIGLLGARRASVDGAARQLAYLAPHHRVEVVSDGYFTAAERPAVMTKLKAMRPDILLVAMGVPQQEFWIDDNLNGEHTTLAIGVGALFDFLAGAVPRAPSWIRHARLEWLFRLGIEPQRLWRRYVVGNPLFLLRAFAQRFSADRLSR
jgi:exopolysaccharide biosynthesis WecB/TagA/CpsF family protein